MEEDSRNSPSREKINFGPDKLRVYFINHLDKIYAAKLHLVKHLPKLVEEIHFTDLKNAIVETSADVEKQIARMEIIYNILDVEHTEVSYRGPAGLIDDAFTDIQLHCEDPELRDLSIAFYMQSLESIEISSFRILQMAAVKLKNKHISKLLLDNYNEAKADRVLLLLITAKYITAK